MRVWIRGKDRWLFTDHTTCVKWHSFSFNVTARETTCFCWFAFCTLWCASYLWGYYSRNVLLVMRHCFCLCFVSFLRAYQCLGFFLLHAVHRLLLDYLTLVSPRVSCCFCFFFLTQDVFFCELALTSIHTRSNNNAVTHTHTLSLLHFFFFNVCQREKFTTIL